MAANLVGINQMKIIIQDVAACASARVGQGKLATSTWLRCYGGAARRVLVCPENGRLLVFFCPPAHFGVHLVLLAF